jgi:hypothetical protein
MDLEKRLYDALRSQIAYPKAPRPDLFRIPPTGEIRKTKLGPTWMVETVYDPGYMHGNIILEPEMAGQALRILDESLRSADFDFRKIAVIDTETTGLAGGSGTYCFIIGIAFWVGKQFVVRQYILRDFHEEPAQLSAFASDLAETTALLTYNGKTFDMPLLRTRFRINRLEIPFADRVHLDFVHPCRRLYRRHMNSLSLIALEEKILGFERADDVPAYLIPRIYFDYLQSRDDNLLLPILNHNREDIVSLYMLVQETSRRIGLALQHSCEDDVFLLSLGQIFLKAGDFLTSLDLLSCVKPQFSSRDIADDALKLRALAAKKSRDWETAQNIWEEMLKSGRFGCYPHVELAKHHEHRLKNPRAALKHTESAMRRIEFEREIAAPTTHGNALELLLKRHRRLLVKIQKQVS